jgi:hypothetical protein
VEDVKEEEETAATEVEQDAEEEPMEEVEPKVEEIPAEAAEPAEPAEVQQHREIIDLEDESVNQKTEIEAPPSIKPEVQATPSPTLSKREANPSTSPTATRMGESSEPESDGTLPYPYTGILTSCSRYNTFTTGQKTIQHLNLTSSCFPFLPSKCNLVLTTYS